MGKFLGVGLATIVTGLAPQFVVVIGEVTSAWDRVGPIVAEVLERRALHETPTRLIPTDHATQPRLRGAVTLVVQQHFGVPERRLALTPEPAARMTASNGVHDDTRLRPEGYGTEGRVLAEDRMLTMGQNQKRFIVLMCVGPSW